jgi:hypothetical protein
VDAFQARCVARGLEGGNNVWCSECPEKVINAHNVRAIVAMLHAILLILTSMIDVVYEFSPLVYVLKDVSPACCNPAML